MEEEGGPPALAKMMAQVFSKAREVRVDVTKRASERGFRARPAGLQSLKVPVIL